MAKGGRIYKITCVIVFILWGVFPAMPLQAGELSLPPHLIQTVSDQDIYEGMLALGLLQCRTLEEEDPETAYANVADSVVRLDMGKAYGSGIIFHFTERGAVIATNRHVLEYWEDTTGVVRFLQGFYAGARLLGTSESSDVGFLLVEKEELGMETLLGLRSVPVEEGVYDSLREGTVAFCLGADRGQDRIIYQEATVEDTGKYIDIFDDEMLYGHGFAKEGMSGGGIFDGYGHLVGLLAGGTWQNEIAGVPVEKVTEAFREISGE